MKILLFGEKMLTLELFNFYRSVANFRRHCALRKDNA